jgi:transposase
LIERGVRPALESGRPIAHVGRDLGIAPETLRKAVRQAEADSGRRGELLSSQEREEIKALRKEVAQLRRANEFLKAARELSTRERVEEVRLIHHSDRGSQYLASDYTQTLDDNDVPGSVGSTGDAYDNAMAPEA